MLGHRGRLQIHSYHTDNRIYQSDEVLKELQAKGQGIKMSGVSAQSQNGAGKSTKGISRALYNWHGPDAPCKFELA